MNDYKQKIEALRKEWLDSPDDRKMIEIRAKLLKIAWAKSKGVSIEQVEGLL
jgi:hypothetical protein